MKKFGKFILVTSALAAAAAGVYLYLKDKGIISDTCTCGCGDDCDCECDEDRSYVSLDKEEADGDFEPMSETVSEASEEDTVEEFFDDEKDSQE